MISWAIQFLRKCPKYNAINSWLPFIYLILLVTFLPLLTSLQLNIRSSLTMDVVGTVMSVTQTLLAALQCSELKEFSSMFGYKSQLDDLQRTVNTVKAIFRDAEAKQELSEVEQQLINELKDVIFEADDLLDEFVTLAKQKQLLKDHGSRSEKMRLFINRLNPHGIPHKMSEGVKKIRKRLDAIARNKQLSFDHDPQPIRNRRSETCSYVRENEIIGREKELKEIIDMLLNSDVQNKVSFLSIVGIGGLGKTALAQVVYNDPRITSAFPLKMWACISDQDQKQLDVSEVLLKILASAATDSNFDQGTSTLDWVQFQLREKLAGKKYLLVLDDVWTEDRVQWFELEQYLIGGQEGSWILVTTRSERTASIVGDGRKYRLQGLSVENSWQLFKKAAFKPDASNPPNNLLDIGREIVDRCARVPLAIKVVGSLLYGQDSVKWESFQKIGLANIMEGENNIMPILKLSYYHLEYPLKSCFSYCAIYPKDYEIKKETLKSLWMAQGYIVPLYTGQSIEDACEQYFSTLLKRCFFQDIQENEAGEIYSVKIHDLVHDVAQSVSKNEIYAARTFSGNLDANVCRHLSISHTLEIDKYILRKSRMRTYLCVDRDHGGLFQIDDLEVIVASYGNLRALGIPGSRIKTLPESTGKLLHLRYLDLSRNIKLEVLPKSITKLCNLQTFLLQGCRNLEELPKDLSRLIKLRVLDITGCHGLSYIPKGMNKLTSINRLSDFIVGGKSCLSWTEWFVQLEELKALNNLIGNLNVTIKWPENIKNVCQEVLKRRGLYLKNKLHLTEIYIRFDYQESDRRLNDEDCFKLMEDLHPPSNLLWLSVWEYPGTRMPKWIFLLKRLVTLKLYKCKELEYIEACGSAEEEPFLPFLEKLKLYSLPKLKGWKRGGVEVEDTNNSQSQLLPRLPRLKKLKINQCPTLTCIPLYPSMKQLSLFHFNKNLKGIVKTESDDKSVEINEFLKLREVEIDDLKWLSSLPVEALQCLEYLKINRGEEVQCLGELKEVLRACCSSLQFLRIDNCHKLSIVARELKNLSALEELTISYCDVDMAIITSPSFLPCLRSLKLEYLPKMMNLPNWIQFLPALQILHIEFCKGLKAMPNWMCKLTSLKQLNVSYCSKTLEKRCKEDPAGDDWPYIQHISNIQICRCIYN